MAGFTSTEARAERREGGSNSVVESQPSKLLVAGSIPVSRSSTLSGTVPTTFDIDTRELRIETATRGGLRGRLSPLSNDQQARPTKFSRTECAGRAGSIPVSRSNDSAEPATRRGVSRSNMLSEPSSRPHTSPSPCPMTSRRNEHAS